MEGHNQDEGGEWQVERASWKRGISERPDMGQRLSDINLGEAVEDASRAFLLHHCSISRSISAWRSPLQSSEHEIDSEVTSH